MNIKIERKTPFKNFSDIYTGDIFYCAVDVGEIEEKLLFMKIEPSTEFNSIALPEGMTYKFKNDEKVCVVEVDLIVRIDE